MSDSGADRQAFGIKELLRGYTAEVTSGDRKSIEAAATLMEPGAEVFIASLPSHTAGKLALAAKEAIDVTLVSQFCFEAAAIVASARRIRAAGVTVPLRVGIAGPASRASLLKYAMICGVGASIRALKERPAARAMLAGCTLEELLGEIAAAQAAEPALGIQGDHFFTFASLAATARFVTEQRQLGVHA
jgi:methylenetetrahydrofolate reductase (NADPH)